MLKIILALLKLKTKTGVVSLTTNEIRSTDQNHVQPIKNNEQLLSSYQLQIVKRELYLTQLSSLIILISIGYR